MINVEKRKGKIVRVWHSEECAINSKVPPECMFEVSDDDADLLSFREAEAEQTKPKDIGGLVEELRKEIEVLRQRIVVLEGNVDLIKKKQ
jgi:hypothetical protein